MSVIDIDTTIRPVSTSTRGILTLVFHPVPLPTKPFVEITPKRRTFFSEEEALAILFPDAESRETLEEAIRRQHDGIREKIRLGELNPIRGWRMIREVDQTELSRMTGILQPNLSRMEQLGARQSLSTLQKIAEALKISVKDLLS
jgi:DNA-binding Xre family transcriptional regulator